MATFRKSASKTRAALESSTALPPATSDVLDHVGEQAARMTNPAKAAKSARKAGSAPAALMPGPTDAEAATAGLAHPAALATDTSPDALSTAVDLTPHRVESAVAEALAGTTQPDLETSVKAEEASTDIATQSIEGTTAEVASTTADIADQVSHAGTEAVETAAAVAAQTLDETAARTDEITSAVAEVAAASIDEATDAIDRASADRFEAGPSQALGEFNARLADLFRDYLEDSLAFFAAMSAVRSVPEALTVNQQHFQRRLDAIAAQNRDLTLLAGKVAAQTLMPFTPAAFR